jgi:hypothetical protein
LQEHGVLAALHERLEAKRSSLEALAQNRDWYAGILASSALPAGTTPPSGSEVVVEPGAEGQRGEDNANVDADWALVLCSCAWNLAGQDRWQLAGYLELSRREREPLVESGAPLGRALQEWRGRKEEARRDAMVLDAIFSRFTAGTLLVMLSTPEMQEDEELYPALRQFMEHTQWVRPRLRGGDLIDMGVEQGPSVGQVLELLRQARVNGRVADEEGERRLVLEWLERDSRGHD